MDYFNAFWFGRPCLCPDPDPSGQDKADAWPCDGTSGMQRRPVKVPLASTGRWWILQVPGPPSR